MVGSTTEKDVVRGLQECVELAMNCARDPAFTEVILKPKNVKLTYNKGKNGAEFFTFHYCNGLSIRPLTLGRAAAIHRIITIIDCPVGGVSARMVNGGKTMRYVYPPLEKEGEAR